MLQIKTNKKVETNQQNSLQLIPGCDSGAVNQYFKYIIE